MLLCRDAELHHLASPITARHAKAGVWAAQSKDREAREREERRISSSPSSRSRAELLCRRRHELAGQAPAPGAAADEHDAAEDREHDGTLEREATGGGACFAYKIRAARPRGHIRRSIGPLQPEDQQRHRPRRSSFGLCWPLNYDRVLYRKMCYGCALRLNTLPSAPNWLRGCTVSQVAGRGRSPCRHGPNRRPGATRIGRVSTKRRPPAGVSLRHKSSGRQVLLTGPRLARAQADELLSLPAAQQAA